LTTLVHEHGKQWTLIASKLAGGRRSLQQCRTRWKSIDPSLTTSKFSSAEDASLTKLVHEHGTSAWTLVASKLEGGKRNDSQCASRWRTINPSLTTGKFSADGDASLIKLVQEHGASAWTLIASQFNRAPTINWMSMQKKKLVTVKRRKLPPISCVFWRQPQDY
jgi:hypothetical protein